MQPGYRRTSTLGNSSRQSTSRELVQSKDAEMADSSARSRFGPTHRRDTLQLGRLTADPMSAVIASLIASARLSQFSTTRCKSASLNATSSHSGRQECSASAARQSSQITQPQGSLPVASKSRAGSIPAAVLWPDLFAY
jgi:hypothetical protein